MTEPTLAEKVRLYLGRTIRDGLLRLPLDKQGLFRLVGGNYGDKGQFRKKMKPEFVEGRFVDTVACAVQQSHFYADWCSQDDPSNCNHGYVELAEIPTLLKKDRALTNALKK